MPFTAGGFLHISLVTVLPELILEENPKESIKQFTLIISGIMVMFVMSHLFEWWCIYSTLFPYSHHIIPFNKKTILLLFYYIITLIKYYPYYLVIIIIFIMPLFCICNIILLSTKTTNLTQTYRVMLITSFFNVTHLLEMYLPKNKIFF